MRTKDLNKVFALPSVDIRGGGGKFPLLVSNPKASPVSVNARKVLADGFVV